MENLSLTFRIAGLTSYDAETKAIIEKTFIDCGDISLEDLNQIISSFSKARVLLTEIERLTSETETKIRYSEDGTRTLSSRRLND